MPLVKVRPANNSQEASLKVQMRDEHAAAKAELERVRKEAQVARQEAAEAIADAEAARAEANAAKAESVKLEAERAAALEQQKAQEQVRIRLSAEERAKEEQHAVELARLEADAHARDAEEQQHNQPVQSLPGGHGDRHGVGGAAPEEGAVRVPAKPELPGAANPLPKDYVNPYDPKPGHVPKVVQHTLPPKIVCDGTMDPFPDRPVDSYEPPAAAQLADKREWKDKQSAMMARIRAFNKGGLPLRAFIDKEVQALVLLRIELFCDLMLQARSIGAAAS